MGKLNPLGDLKAEADHAMLDASFYGTPDYHTIKESREKSIVVGRRGTGKSALCYQLRKDHEVVAGTKVFVFAPEDYEVSAVRYSLRPLGGSYNLTKSASKLIVKYALSMELAQSRTGHFKFKELEDAEFIRNAANDWAKSGESFYARLAHCLKLHIEPGSDAENLVGSLASKLQSRRIEAFITAFCDHYDSENVFLFDKLDEGYEHDTLGIAFLAGLTDVVAHYNTSFSRSFRGLVFLRDNIARSIERDDPDFSRSFEGQVLRLHWGRYELFNMACNRLRVAFKATHENSQRVWDSLTTQSISGTSGFDHCLRLTLYRPRDLLVLLNEAFNRAAKHQRPHIDDSDVATTAKDISQRRLNDLIKEYGPMLHGLDRLISVFSNNGSHWKLPDACSIVDSILATENLPIEVAQHWRILGDSSEILRSLYSIGFLGLKSETTQAYTFCHDGKTTDVEFATGCTILIHPCYWMALNITDNPVDATDVAAINDEYDELKIEVASFSKEQRSRRLGMLIADLGAIDEGELSAAQFEKWCKEAIAIVYSGALSNVDLHVNGAAVQRRDVVGRNDGTRPAWKRILDDFESRQVIFEIKNFSHDLGPDEFRQMGSYLVPPYGRLGFIVNRSKSLNLERDREILWVKEMWAQQKLIVKLNAAYLSKMLSKLRNPQKHDEPDTSLNGLLDQYERLYLSLQSQHRSCGKNRKMLGST